MGADREQRRSCYRPSIHRRIHRTFGHIHHAVTLCWVASEHLGDIPKLPLFQRDKATSGLLPFLTSWVTSKEIGESLPRDVAQAANPRPSAFPLELAPGFLRLTKLGPKISRTCNVWFPQDSLTSIPAPVSLKPGSHNVEKRNIKPIVAPHARLWKGLRRAHFLRK